ncbi:MAG TPA: ATP-binding cassette domain-containing protein, partial [Candidatus Omnitrophota bacterium]|nr:ATP-binding cassette domain-containing protein [Candidatus Omnitrophota bacterium]
KIALIGKNGSGKTTLLRILAGIYSSTSGALDVRQKPAILFRSLAGVFPDLPVIDNIYFLGTIYGIQRDYLSRRVEEVLECAELGHLKFCPMKDLSSGQKQRLILSIFFETKNDFLIFDESLSAVDYGFGLKVEKRLKADPFSCRTMIMTSHSAEFLRRHCRTAIWLDEGRIRMHGEVNEVLEQYEQSLKIG